MRSRYGLILIAGLLAFMLPANANAQEAFAKVGTFSMQFLKLGVSARATGMGSAFTAIADDATATYWNPAGIVDVTRTEVSLNHTVWPADVSLDFAAAVFALPFLPGAWGVSARALSIDPQIERTIFLPVPMSRAIAWAIPTTCRRAWRIRRRCRRRCP